jgi:hypothetical protein
VDFRRSKTRNDGRAVEIKRSRSFEIGAVSQDVGCTQPGKNFLPRMSVSIAGSHSSFFSDVGHERLCRRQIVSSWTCPRPPGPALEP